MKLLAMDSSALVASVALCEDDIRLGEITIENGNTHSETLLPNIEFLLSRFSLDVAHIDAFAVSAGPGSFTGVRIGAATAKGLAFGTGKPCVGVSTLEALAQNLAHIDGLIVPVMNARRGQVYTAVFSARNGVLSRLSPDSAIAITELDALLGNYEEPVRLVGDGYEITAERLTHPILPVPHSLRGQSAYSVAQVARRMLEAGGNFSDITLSPSYLRLSQAERERRERMGPDTGI